MLGLSGDGQQHSTKDSLKMSRARDCDHLRVTRHGTSWTEAEKRLCFRLMNHQPATSQWTKMFVSLSPVFLDVVSIFLVLPPVSSLTINHHYS